MFGIIKGVHINADILYEACQKYGILILIAGFLCTPAAETLFEKGKDRLVGMIVLAALFWLCVWYVLTMGDNPFMYFRF
jgi:uncharacterized membrane protein YccC